MPGEMHKGQGGLSSVWGEAQSHPRGVRRGSIRKWVSQDLYTLTLASSHAGFGFTTLLLAPVYSQLALEPIKAITF